MPDFSRCAFSEGSVALPDGYSDRTVNVLLAGDDFSPSLNISRDALQEGRVLVFTLAHTRKLLPQDDVLLQQVLDSYQPA